MFFFFGGKGCVLLGDSKKMVVPQKRGTDHISHPREVRKIMDSKVQAGNMSRRVLLLMEEILHQLIW